MVEDLALDLELRQFHSIAKRPRILSLINTEIQNLEKLSKEAGLAAPAIVSQSPTPITTAAEEELKNTTIKMAEQSKVLNTLGAEKQTKRELFDALRQEFETPRAQESLLIIWELILNSDGLGKDISETVERVFCRLSGGEPLLFPLPNVETQPCKETENETEKEKEEHENEKDNSNSASKKRRYTQLNEEGGDNEVAK